MFKKILVWIREVLNKMINTTSVKNALSVDVAISSEMTSALQIWNAMYLNKSSWLTDDVKSLNLASTIAAEIARAVTIEMEVTLSGSPRADFLGEQIARVVDRLRLATEYGAAKGGLMLKPYISGNQLAVDYVQADQFYPVAFDANGNMTVCVFSDTRVIGKDYYTRLEYHALTDGGYEIKNMAYRSSDKDTLGTQVPLNSVQAWAELQAEAMIVNVDRPLFAYFKMPFANNIDPTSPLGVSIYSRAVSLIEQADKLWTEFIWEFESAHRVLYTDPNAFQKDPKTGLPVLPNRRLYRTLDLNGKIDQPGLFEDWTPTIREVNLLNGLDAILKKIEIACGLAQGTISDPATVALTATEIKMSKQRTYATIVDTQKALQNALENLLYAMDVWATLGNLAPQGKYSAVYYFDDSIVADHDTAFAQDLQLLDRVMGGVEFRMRRFGEDEATARKMIAMMNNDKQPVDFFATDGGL